MEYILIIIGAIFVNNIVLNQFLGICPFLGVSKKISTAAGMSGAVLFVMTLATIVTWLIQNYILNPFNIGFLQTITFILKKISPALFQALGIFLPLITTNCAVLGVAILTVQKDFNLLEGVVFAISNAIGFGLALILFSGIREHLDLMEVPKGMRGVPIALLSAGILALAFMGFSNLV